MKYFNSINSVFDSKHPHFHTFTEYPPILYYYFFLNIFMYEQFIISSIFISTAFPTWEITLLLQSLSKDLSIAQRLHSFEHVRKTVLM